MSAKSTGRAAPAKPDQQDPPVYDERGNVRPRGTKGARPMTYDERVAIAAKTAAQPAAQPAGPTAQPSQESSR